MNKKTIGFIGFGLMAGSIAKCLRKAYPNITMLALNNRYPTVKPGLKMALDDREREIVTGGTANA